jgi:hypothetical protein
VSKSAAFFSSLKMSNKPKNVAGCGRPGQRGQQLAPVRDQDNPVPAFAPVINDMLRAFK